MTRFKARVNKTDPEMVELIQGSGNRKHVYAMVNIEFFDEATRNRLYIEEETIKFELKEVE